MEYMCNRVYGIGSVYKRGSMCKTCVSVCKETEKETVCSSVCVIVGSVYKRGSMCVIVRKCVTMCVRDSM